MSLGRLIGLLLLQLFLIFINAFFSASEISLIQLSSTRLRKMQEEGDHTAGRIIKLVEHPSSFLSAIQIGITLANLLASAFAADNFADPLAQQIFHVQGFTTFSYPVLRIIIIVLITLILAFFTLVLGELVPKQVALHKPYQVAKATTGVIAGLTVVVKPVIWLLSTSTRLVLRLFGIHDEKQEEIVTEDEIRMLVDAGHERGTIDPEEKEMIDNVFELDKTLARDVMTHRVDMVTIEADATPEEILQIIEESGMSRFPVYDDSLDNILGIISSRTYLINMRKDKPCAIRDLLRPARFVPETIKADDLLKAMQQNHNHMAIVVDEYGGCSGLVTLEDLIEEIVGNIYDEFDIPQEPEICQLGDNLWRVSGEAEIEEMEKEMSIKFPADREYDTFGGLVFCQLSAIPDDGKEVVMDAEGLHIHTEPVEDHHIQWARVSILPPPEPEPEEETKNTKRNGNKKEKEPDEKETQAIRSSPKNKILARRRKTPIYLPVDKKASGLQ